MADELSECEQALRRLPLPYSLALRLRDAGVAADVICQYVNVERAALNGLYRIAEAKLLAAQNATDDRYHKRLTQPTAPRLSRGARRAVVSNAYDACPCRLGMGQARTQDGG